MSQKIAAIVLAAGKGTRMKAPPDKNKVVFELDNKPIISYTYETLLQCGFEKIVVVVGYASESVKNALGNKVTYALQEVPQGTGHAVKVALPHISDEYETIISLYGDDSAFYPASLLKLLLDEHQQYQAEVTVMTLHKKDPTGLGRIIRNDQNQVIAIVEEKNASPEEKVITEINTGLYCFNHQFLRQALDSIDKNPVTGEYYLTDVIGYACANGFKVHAVTWPSDDIWYGVNTPEQLEEASTRMRMKSAVK